MKINRWWESDPEEIYWLELTDRDNLGDDLNAPQRRDDGREFWDYSLINEISDGDSVFHYHKHDKAVVAWSKCLPERDLAPAAQDDAASDDASHRAHVWIRLEDPTG